MSVNCLLKKNTELKSLFGLLVHITIVSYNQMTNISEKMSCVIRKPFCFTYAKIKTKISCTVAKTKINCAVTIQLNKVLVFALWLVQAHLLLNPKFQTSSLFLGLYRPICVTPGQKLRRPVFS